MTSESAPEFQLIVTAQDLRANPDAAEVILRVGALINGVMFAARSINRADLSTVSGQSDQLFGSLAVSGYVHELVPLLNRRFDGLAWKLAAAGEPIRSLPEPESVEGTKILLANDSAFVSTCAHIRHKHAFHVDGDVVMRWLSQFNEAEGIAMYTLSGPLIEDVVCDAAALALQSSAGAVTAGTTFLNDVSRLMHLLPYFHEAMVIGFGRLRDCRVWTERSTPRHQERSQ